jgi:GNAT superfamily N-acetyltransferase
LSRASGVRECQFGFFECVDDYAVAKALLDHVRALAKARGLATLYGPFNLDREDSYGVLVEGRDRPPVILCGHTPPYYQHFLESYGFAPARGDNLAFAIDPNDDSPALRKLSRLADWLRDRREITVRAADFTRWRDESAHVHRLMNAALAHLPDHIDWPLEAVQALLEPFLAIADPELILFAEVGGEVVGFFPGLPNLNEALIHANGLRYPWDYARLWWHMRRPSRCLAIKSVLVLPEHWAKGVAVLLFDEMLKRVRARDYQWADLSLTSDDNPYTPELAARMGAKVYKRYRVYRMGV